MPIAPFAPRPVSHDVEVRRARIAVAAAVIGIAAALLAYAISPGIRHAVGHAARGVGHAVSKVADRVFPDHPKAAPALPVESLSGPAVTLASLHGRPALIIFWSTTCTTCASGAAGVETFARGAGAGQIVGVAVGGTRADALRFVRAHGWSFSNLRDGNGTVTARYGIHGASALPATVVLDTSGHIAGTLHGVQTPAQLQKALDSSTDDR